MTVETLSAFLLTATMLTIVPGLDTAVVLRSAASEGGRAGVMAAVGIAIGCLCWGSAAAFGLGRLLHAWPLAFDMLRWAGAAYLAWVGFNLLARPRKTLAGGAGSSPSQQPIDAVLRGFLTNILNPKVGLFYLTLLPQFLARDAEVGDAMILASMHVGIALLWFIVLAMVTGWLHPWLRRPGTVSTLDRASGAIFMLLGAQLGLFAASQA